MEKVLLFVICLLFISCFSWHKSDALVDVATFSKLQQKNDVQLIDVRTLEEFEEEHIENAINIDIENDNFKTTFGKLDSTKLVLIYCRTGSRSARATTIAKELGFTKIAELDGGIKAWKLEGKPVFNK